MPTVWSRLVSGLRAGIAAFREQHLDANLLRAAISWNAEDWVLWEPRRSRYAMYWALYQNNLYQDKLHPLLSRKYKTDLGMYRFTRHIYSPFYALGEFYAGKVFGGRLDLEAGDGEEEKSAIPILTDHEAIRPALARLWRDSRLQTGKELIGRYGAILGDIAIRICDDPVRERVYLELVHPGDIEWLDRDASGNVKGHIIQQQRWDPRYNAQADRIGGQQKQVAYREEAFRENGQITFRTYLDNEPYDWRDYPEGTAEGLKVGPEWSEPYDFDPLVLIEHEQVGLGWGMNCFHCGLAMGREIDDLASVVGDQARKAVKAPILIAGAQDPMAAGGKLPKAKTNTPTPYNPQPGRDELPFFYVSDPDVTATHMTFNLDLPGLLEHIKNQMENLERNFPELLATIHTAAGDASGRALRVARAQASAKVQARRAGYDDALMRAFQMAITIGGIKGYPDYAGFGEDSYERGDLDFQIGHRPVFDVDPMDELEEYQLFWANAQAATSAGLPLKTYLRTNGWTEKDIAAMEKDQKADTERQMDQAMAAQQKRFATVMDRGGNLNGAADDEDEKRPSTNGNGAY